jgi:signal transduction histidine kinase
MMYSSLIDRMMILFTALDPRRSLVARAMSLIIALTITFSVVAAVWVGNIARQNVLEQHARRLALETDQLSSDLGQAVAAHLGAVRSVGSMLGAGESPDGGLDLAVLFDELIDAYPQFEWVAIADPKGVIVKAKRDSLVGTDVQNAAWFTAGHDRVWLGVMQREPSKADGFPTPPMVAASTLGDIALPVRDRNARLLGVIAAHLSWPRTPDHPQRLTDEVRAPLTTRAYVLDRDGTVLIGPDAVRGRRWSGVFARASAPDAGGGPQFERLPDGTTVLVARESLGIANGEAPVGLQVQLSEPKERVYQRADALAAKILWVSLSLGASTALIGALAVQHLTRRLKRLTFSVASIGRTDTAQISVPPGQDEVTQLGAAFAKLLEDLQQERSELKALSNELERRVAVRTREVERLADESRYAAVVRERLKMARDLHDTLAHSIMALLSEIRLMRRLHIHDPASLTDELARAEQLAHQGLKEARTAISQIRVNAVRETGLGAAISSAFERFLNHTGLSGDLRADPEAARFGDDRAETLLRMTQEALRNVERHAMATRVDITLGVTAGLLDLSITDNGVGFDVDAVGAEHFGLVGLREQADLIGAELRIDSEVHRGTRVSVKLRASPMNFGTQLKPGTNGPADT